MPWDSIEFAKLGIQAVTPLVAIFVAFKINKAIERFKHGQWRNQKLIERRISAYDAISSDLNDIICYFAFVGRWKEFSPIDILNKKRNVDKTVYLSAPFFSSDIVEIYHEIEEMCFDIYSGTGQDAKIKSSCNHRKKFFIGNWDKSWDARFTDDMLTANDYFDAYQALIKAMSKEMGLEEQSH